MNAGAVRARVLGVGQPRQRKSQEAELGKRLQLDTLLRLSQTPGIIGIKAYTPYLELQRYFYKLHQPGRFVVISGDEYQYAAALLLGVRCFTMGGPGNFCPAYCTSIYRLALDGQWDAVSEMQKRLAEFCDAVYAPAQTAYAAIKGMHQCLDICETNISSPHVPLSAEGQTVLREVLLKYGDMVNGKDPQQHARGNGKHPLHMHAHSQVARREA